MNIKDFLEGNRKYCSRADDRLLKKLAENGQSPAAAIVSCSDSRVPVEVIFNQLKPGAVFVIRVAGNVVADSSVKGSIEYAVEHLKIPLLIVLGHTDCGAVKASLAGTSGGEIRKLVSSMQLRSRELGQAVLENIDLQIKRVLDIACVKEAVDNRKIEVYGMLYDLAGGEVRCLSKNGSPFTGD
jgi:carbonic anhydrase